MSKTSTSLEKIMKYLEISNSTLAKAIIVDASLISRWMNGQRQLRLSSDNLNRLSDYSNQLMLTHEFQMLFNDLWNKENYSEGCRRKTIRILQEISEQLRVNHGL